MLMKNKIEQHHTIDFVFALLFFCLFAMCSLVVIFIGSQVYSSTVNTLEQNYTQYTVIDYIQEKVRHNLAEGQIEVQDFNQYQVLCIHETYQQTPYTTYIYCNQGALKELFISDDQTFDKERGEIIMEIDHVSFQLQEMMLTITVENQQQIQKTELAIIGG